jgi:hypothetical protein
MEKEKWVTKRLTREILPHHDFDVVLPSSQRSGPLEEMYQI